MTPTQQTANTTQTPVSFPKASARKLPTLACVGYVGEVEEGHLSESGNYVVQPINVEPLGGGKGRKLQLLYRPDWFRAGFRPDNLLKMEGGTGAHFIYQKHINVEGGIANLRGLCGSDERFAELYSRLIALPDADENQPGIGPSIEDVQATLTDFFANNVDEAGEPMTFIYILVQGKTDTGEVDEDGKKIKLRNQFYEFQSFADNTEKNRKAKATKAAKTTDGSYKWTYQNEPF